MLAVRLEYLAPVHSDEMLGLASEIDRMLVLMRKKLLSIEKPEG